MQQPTATILQNYREGRLTKGEKTAIIFMLLIRVIIRNMVKLPKRSTMGVSILETMNGYLETIQLSRSEHTARTYANAIKSFRATLADHGYPVNSTELAELSEDAVAWFAADLKAWSPATERVYLTAVTSYYEYLVAERLLELNLPRVHLLVRQRARRTGIRLPQFPRDDIETVIEYAINIDYTIIDDEQHKLQAMRDRAFLLTLADSGLRVHEACKLRRGDVDWNEGQAIITGKGDKQAVIRFSDRSLRALKDYLSARAALDGASGRPLTSLPLFARHDRGAGKKVKSITTRTGQNIINQRVKESLGEAAVGTITPHSFRHYFVTTVLRASGNMKLAQELARHSNIAITQRYAHLSDDELDRGYHEIFNR
jgi:integrase/recombinase XerC